MIYTVADIHGRYDKYENLLREINLNSADTLYILGDVLDRGEDGFKILSDISSRSNIKMLLGNHEAMAIDALPCIMKALRESGTQCDLMNLPEKDLQKVVLWFYNKGETSLKDFFTLTSEQRQSVWEYMLNLPLYAEITVGLRKFVLVHGGLEHFSKTRSLSDYKQDEIVWCRPKKNTVYYSDKYVVFGHTPTQLLCGEYHWKGKPGKIVRDGKLIDIDCGCIFPDGQLGCLCLDTMEEIYI